MPSSQQQPTFTDGIRWFMDDVRDHLSVDYTINEDAMHTVETTMMATADNNRVCYFCNQPGHIARYCPQKGQQRQRIGRIGQSRGHAHQQRQPPYQIARQPPLSHQPPSRNIIPNRPDIPHRPQIRPSPAPNPVVAHNAHHTTNYSPR